MTDNPHGIIYSGSQNKHEMPQYQNQNTFNSSIHSNTFVRRIHKMTLEEQGTHSFLF